MTRASQLLRLLRRRLEFCQKETRLCQRSLDKASAKLAQAKADYDHQLALEKPAPRVAREPRHKKNYLHPTITHHSTPDCSQQRLNAQSEIDAITHRLIHYRILDDDPIG